MTTKNRESEVVWEPQPGPQSAFVHCPVPEIFFGGARGGGAAAALVWYNGTNWTVIGV